MVLGEERFRKENSVWDADVLPPSRGGRVVDWSPSLKHYPHFDKPIRHKDIEELVRNPDAVSRNSFYPFMRFEEKWQPFRDKVGGKPKKKIRQLRFASRRDAYIYSYYRHILRDPYEASLRARDLEHSVIAYRKLVTPTGKGKSNIDFALDAFNVIRNFGHAAVVTLDISAFFESIDHELLRQKWCSLLGTAELPRDHRAVFRAITRYSIVDRDAAYERLGYLTWEAKGAGKIPVYTTGFKDMPRQLCSNSEFREKICGKGGTFASLIETNENDFGIPQGSPISDMLANIYLIDFDSALKAYVDAVGGTFFRYSDDIIIIVPGEEIEAIAARDFAMNEIKKHGSKLLIKESKTSVLRYFSVPGGQDFKKIHGEQGTNGLEYLGFRYDGKAAYLRDSTMSRLYRKVTRSIRAEARALVRRYPEKDQSYIESKFNAAKFMQRYGRVEDFDPKASYDTWTFWTYARRAIEIFGPLGKPISGQLKNYGQIVRTRMTHEIAHALS
ncbi:reverse transcriptase domain-containing protein [Sphingomonas sp. H39-1-10]|uniref:reverse transcriptase domain-containing protein n=1 Tax=Sphingomonas pollutisoli TaxID=3030829 RepID=UPI0023B8F12F|nr:reverse transcriptase domain-containing protein [Sphingomonas pollutisoli]MDF0487262.1 reverse transcriptase domain-containing protein [Sphingomonas pollutisoli]